MAVAEEEDEVAEEAEADEEDTAVRVDGVVTRDTEVTADTARADMEEAMMVTAADMIITELDMVVTEATITPATPTMVISIISSSISSTKMATISLIAIKMRFYRFPLTSLGPHSWTYIVH